MELLPPILPTSSCLHLFPCSLLFLSHPLPYFHANLWWPGLFQSCLWWWHGCAEWWVMFATAVKCTVPLEDESQQFSGPIGLGHVLGALHLQSMCTILIHGSNHSHLFPLSPNCSVFMFILVVPEPAECFLAFLHSSWGLSIKETDDKIMRIKTPVGVGIVLLMKCLWISEWSAEIWFLN